MIRTVFAGVAVVLAAAPALAAEDACDRTDWASGLVIATASEGGTYFVYGTGLARLITERLGIPAEALATGGPGENLALLQAGAADLALTTLGPAQDALEGRDPLAPGVAVDRMRAAFPMFQTPFSIIALRSSGIAGVADLPHGAAVGVGPVGGTSDAYFPAILEALGAHIDPRNGGAAEQARQLRDGQLDAFAFATGAPIPVFRDLEASADVTIFGFTEAEQDALTAAFPVARYAIPAGTYQSVEGDLPVVSMWSFAVVPAEMPDCLVYELVDLVMGEHDRMVEIHGAAAETLPGNAGRNTVLPWHPGALAWYEEHGYDVGEAADR